MMMMMQKFLSLRLRERVGQILNALWVIFSPYLMNITISLKCLLVMPRVSIFFYF